MLQQPPLPASFRLPAQTALNRLETEHGKLWRPRSGIEALRCPTCHDKGRYRWWNPDRTEVVAWECTCEDQYLMHRFFLWRGIGPADMRLSWKDMESTPAEFATFMADYIEHLDGYVAAGIGAVLTGTWGTGKTSYAHLLLRHLLAKGYDGHMIRVPELVERSRQGRWSDSESDQSWWHRRVRNVDILVIDDLGKEYLRPGVTQSEVESAAMIEDLLRHRASAARPTILTTNLDRQSLGVRYGRSVLEVFDERSIVVPVTGDDFRVKQQARLIDEAKHGLSRPIVVG